jgi:Xaa-Pro aminopeptidase
MGADGLDGFLVPKADAHQGEYVAPRDERLTWLTGFTGSAGFAAILRDKAGLFVDGRYRLQARQQVATTEFDIVHWPEIKLAEWLIGSLSGPSVIGFDPWLHTAKDIAALRKALTPEGHTLRPVSNLIDPLWQDQPAAPAAAAFVYPSEYAGQPHADKRQDMAKALRSAGQNAAVITLPDSIAWLLNIRGADIPRIPIAQGFAILHDTGAVDLFMHPAKTQEIREHLGNDVTCHPPGLFLSSVSDLKGQVVVDVASAPVAVADAVENGTAELVAGQDPCILPKAAKSVTELAGTRVAHLRDGAAMVRFLAWLDQEAPTGKLTEIDVVRALEGFREATGALKDISFETIAGAGPHGAIVHYRVTEDTNRAVNPGDVLLVDSGGQYLDGTTDITRTIAVGNVAEDAKEAFTRVLRGMIAISRTRFPKGRAGRDLDALARAPLWEAGLDYDHGTGHGVGVYLSVHEGPQRLSSTSDVPLASGMILSNEPGYYREGAFGIRIENLIVVQEAAPVKGADDRDMLSFETLTFVPIDRNMILPALMTQTERDWLNIYHQTVWDKISPMVDGTALDWLKKAVQPV